MHGRAPSASSPIPRASAAAQARPVARRDPPADRLAGKGAEENSPASPNNATPYVD